MLPFPIQLTTLLQTNICSLSQVIKMFLENIIFQNTNPIPLELEDHSLHTIPLVREHLDLYLY